MLVESSKSPILMHLNRPSKLVENNCVFGVGKILRIQALSFSVSKMNGEDISVWVDMSRSHRNRYFAALDSLGETKLRNMFLDLMTLQISRKESETEFHKK